MRPDAARAALWAARTVRRRWSDVAARYVVSVGGLATVVSILTMLAFLSAETWPLLQGARVVGVDKVRLPKNTGVLAIGVDEYQESLQVLHADGTIALVRLSDGQIAERLKLPGVEGQAIRSARRLDPDQVFAWLENGHLIAARLKVEPVFEASGRRLVTTVESLGDWPVPSEEQTAATFAVSRFRDGALKVAWIEGSGRVALWFREVQTSLFGEAEATEARTTLAVDDATALALDRRGSRLSIGRRNGGVQVWDISDPQTPVLLDERAATEGETSPITAVEYLIGDQSFVVGDARGRVTVWQPVRSAQQQGKWVLQRIHTFAPHAASVAWIAPSQRDKGFVTTDAEGRVALRHSTSEQTLLELALGERAMVAPVLAPKANGIVAVGADGTVTSWRVDNPHPEITLRTLFGKVWYEGYDAPAFVWQSTGGTDDFEPKFSLVPLLFGTVKGTVYALLFAVPITVLAALYTALFSPPALRNLVKPTVEVMAALPSVVLGFVAGLVLAPALERHMPGFLAAVVAAPLIVSALGVLWFLTPRAWKGALPHGVEVALAAVVLCGVGAAFWFASGWLERTMFGGDFRHWLAATLDLRFDQRNCVVVGLAMGFAVIPLIFSITEEALSNVPQRLISASLALGATPWQTATRVVLPAASPGIFSAVMIGFGRAVGETMIVLMATGNTPVMDWSIFTGMRTLSANIAVEIPEAPYASTLYRVLFLAALLLFFVTFAVNTAAELVRQRLRERYQRM
ncbi:Phosphate transport system permease protein PstC 1 [bacterium HR30]|nr:Phosphate transport system permease protein PstC 1 [bacterium HR30]